MDYPKRIEQHKHESDSFSIILYKLKEIGIFRNITENDYGIDFEIEVVNGNQVEGHCIKVQVKSSDNLKIRKKNGHAKVGGIKQSSLYYWAELSYNTPVVAMAVDLTTENIYVSNTLFWQAVRLIDGSKKGKRQKSKSIDFGNACDNETIIHRLKKIAYSYGLRDELNAHKWLLRNLVNIMSLYEDSVHCDDCCAPNDEEFVKTFLESSRIFLGIKSYPGDKSVEKLKRYFDFSSIKRSNESGELDYYLLKKVMDCIFQILLPMLMIYREMVIDSAYYWVYKDPDYLKLVVTTDIPNKDDEDELCKYGVRNEYDKRNRKEVLFDKFLEETEQKYGFAPNELFIKFLSL